MIEHKMPKKHYRRISNPYQPGQTRATSPRSRDAVRSGRIEKMNRSFRNHKLVVVDSPVAGSGQMKAFTRSGHRPINRIHVGWLIVLATPWKISEFSIIWTRQAVNAVPAPSEPISRDSGKWHFEFTFDGQPQGDSYSLCQKPG
jgi:hypothetical protein